MAIYATAQPPLRTRKPINFNCYQLMMMTARGICGLTQSFCIFMMNYVKGISNLGAKATPIQFDLQLLITAHKMIDIKIIRLLRKIRNATRRLARISRKRSLHPRCKMFVRFRYVRWRVVD